MSLSTRTFQQLLRPLERTPLHPQFLVLRHRDKTYKWVNNYARGTLVDVGCGNSKLRDMLPGPVRYIAIDYPTTISLGYSGNAHILADAAKLPLATASADQVTLLDVLEHLANPDEAVAEAARVLRDGGTCLIHVPFMYPLHDEPHDYQRWSRHGLQRLLERHGLKTDEIKETISPVETSAALLSISLSKALIDSVRQRSPALLLAPLLIPVIPIINALGWLLGKLLPSSRFLSFSYRAVATMHRTPVSGSIPTDRTTKPA